MIGDISSSSPVFRFGMLYRYVGELNRTRQDICLRPLFPAFIISEEKKPSLYPKASSPLPFLTVPLRLSSFSSSCFLVASYSFMVMEAVGSFELRNRHTTAQSSTFDVGYVDLHALTAESTTALVAYDRVGQELTILTTSSFVSTSQICEKKV